VLNGRIVRAETAIRVQPVVRRMVEAMLEFVEGR
jgi:hypothetical protein